MATKKAARSTPAAKSNAITNIENIRKLCKIANTHHVTQIDIENGAERLTLRFTAEESKHVLDVPTVAYPALQQGIQALSPAALSQPMVAHPETTTASPSPSAAEQSASEKEGELITSPFVGTFYRSPSPEAPPFVEKGQSVKKGDVMCIVEAMKLMNEIESEFDGKVVEILVNNAEPVEFGQALFRVLPNA